MGDVGRGRDGGWGQLLVQRRGKTVCPDPPAALYKDKGKMALLPLYLDGLYWASCLPSPPPNPPHLPPASPSSCTKISHELTWAAAAAAAAPLLLIKKLLLITTEPRPPE